MLGNNLLVVLALVAIFAHVEASRNARKRLFQMEEQGNATAKDSHRKGKLFSLFNVVTFANAPCASTSTVNGRSRNGTCFTTTECTDKGGSSSGNCAAGFGVCCLFVLDGTGTTTITQNCSYVQNSGFPTAVTGATTQSFTVSKCNNDVCFLRLDFETFTLLGTNGSTNTAEGACTDTFVVSTPTAMIIPTICGENTGQHMYVDVGAASGDTATLAFTTTTTTSNRLWDVKITQIECNNPNAPRGSSCLQYLTGGTGRLQSFNYANTNDNHLNNQQYSICIRQESGFCCVEYAVCADQMTLIGGTGEPAGFSFDTRQTVGRNDGVCQSATNGIDYIAINLSGATCAPAGGATDRAINNRYCGRYLSQNAGTTGNTPICDCTGPFQVDVFFDNQGDVGAATANARQSRGFCLEYRQIPCR